MGDRWARFKHKGNVNIGKLISDSDMEIILARDLDSQSYDMAVLRGVYHSELSSDRQTVTVKYTKVSCG